MSRILIAGCGYVGNALGLELARTGHDVWGLRRHGDAVVPPIRPIQADLRDPGSLVDLPGAPDVVVYAAGADARTPDAYRATYVDGPRNLIDSLLASGAPPRRFLYVSSTAVYGQMDGGWVDETSETEPADFTGHVLLEGERLVLASPVPACVVRLAGIYGPGRTRLVDSVRSGTARSTHHYTNRIHRDDCAGVLRHLIELPEAAPVYIGVDDEPSEQSFVLEWLARRLNVPLPATASGVPPREGANKRCSNARLAASGYRFRYPTFRDGYDAMLA